MPLASVPPERLRWRCDPDQLGYESTEEVAPLEAVVGQDRALDAVELGLSVQAAGYNVFVVGPSGTGRTTTIRREVERAAARRPAPDDWCYVHNFRVPYRPLAVRLPPE